MFKFSYVLTPQPGQGEKNDGKVTCATLSELLKDIAKIHSEYTRAEKNGNPPTFTAELIQTIDGKETKQTFNDIQTCHEYLKKLAKPSVSTEDQLAEIREKRKQDYDNQKKVETTATSKQERFADHIQPIARNQIYARWVANPDFKQKCIYRFNDIYEKSLRHFMSNKANINSTMDVDDENIYVVAIYLLRKINYWIPENKSITLACQSYTHEIKANNDDPIRQYHPEKPSDDYLAEELEIFFEKHSPKQEIKAKSNIRRFFSAINHVLNPFVYAQFDSNDTPDALSLQTTFWEKWWTTFQVVDGSTSVTKKFEFFSRSGLFDWATGFTFKALDGIHSLLNWIVFGIGVEKRSGAALAGIIALKVFTFFPLIAVGIVNIAANGIVRHIVSFAAAFAFTSFVGIAQLITNKLFNDIQKELLDVDVTLINKKRDGSTTQKLNTFLNSPLNDANIIVDQENKELHFYEKDHGQINKWDIKGVVSYAKNPAILTKFKQTNFSVRCQVLPASECRPPAR